MTGYARSILMAGLVIALAAGCGGGDEAPPETPKEAPTEAQPEATPTPTPTPTAEATPTPTPSPTATPTPTVVSDAAVPPDAAADAAGLLLAPDSKLYKEYSIKTKDGGEFVVKFFEKRNDKIWFVRSGGEISVPVSDISSIEGIKHEEQ